MLNSIPNIANKNVILAADFNFFFNTSLETQGGNPILKKKCLARLQEIKQTLDLCDIWRIRNPKSKRFSFHGRIQRRLDLLLIPNFLQETFIRADLLASFCSDHSTIFTIYKIFIVAFESNNKRGKSMWKFNKSLLSNDEYINKFRNHISKSLSFLNQNSIIYHQIRWEYIKFEIRQFSITFSKHLSKSLNAETETLEKELKDFEKPPQVTLIMKTI